MRVFSALFLFFPLLVFGQVNSYLFPKDTSFNVQSAYHKIKKDFPDASIVYEFCNLKIEEEREVIYYSVGDRDLHADLFYPSSKGSTKLPAVILIHGGGWTSGNKSHLVPMAQQLADNGFFAATVEHRLSPEAKYPAAIIDLKTAVKWVKLNADKYYIDTTKVAILGCSSGATLASFIASTGQHKKFQSHEIGANVSDRVQALINIDGVVDFTHPAESGKDIDPLKPSAGARWFGFTYEQNPEMWEEASAVNYVNALTPPTLYINSALPRFHAGRGEFLEVLNKYGIYNKTYTISDTPHPFWLFHPWFDETWSKVVSFMQHSFQ